jgi:hypothetical protein
MATVLSLLAHRTPQSVDSARPADGRAEARLVCGGPGRRTGHRSRCASTAQRPVARQLPRHADRDLEVTRWGMIARRAHPAAQTIADVGQALPHQYHRLPEKKVGDVVERRDF